MWLIIKVFTFFIVINYIISSLFTVRVIINNEKIYFFIIINYIIFNLFTIRVFKAFLIILLFYTII